MKNPWKIALFLIITISVLLPNFLPFSAFAQAVSRQDNTTFSLVTEHNAIVPGQPLQAGIIIEHREGWHTYWENPGDAGMPTTLTWTLPVGFIPSAVDWPTPDRMAEGPLVTYGYHGKILLPVTIQVPREFNATEYTLKVKVDVLVCKDICIPESAEMQIQLPITANSPKATEYAPLFEQHRKNRPQPLEAKSVYSLLQNKLLSISIPFSAIRNEGLSGAYFFIREPNLVQYAGKQTLMLSSEYAVLTLERTEEMPQGPISGIVNLQYEDGSTISYNTAFTAAPAQPSSSPSKSQSQAVPALHILLALALLGGMILNLMPCVLPVLSLKALAVVKKGHGTHRHIVKQGIAYTLGVLISFAFIAGLLISIRQGGEAIGWGYQMQSPVFVACLAYLLFLVGLNLSGYFELPVLFGNTNHRVNHSSSAGSFFTGVLATAVATPCTAPFMATAIGAALTLPPLQAFLVFEALGLGLALPFLLISLFPSLRTLLPKPGAWMETFKQFLAFPMYGSVIWLLWVLTLQTGASGLVAALICLLWMTFAIWISRMLLPSIARTVFITGVLISAVFFSIPTFTPQNDNTEIEQGVSIVPYSAEVLDKLRTEGKAVYLDATAAWCITCQVNARTALHTKRTMDIFRERQVTLMIADWTSRNDEITKLLTEFGYKGVPLNVYYPPEGKPVVLPQLLTESIIINTLEGK